MGESSLCIGLKNVDFRGGGTLSDYYSEDQIFLGNFGLSNFDTLLKKYLYGAEVII